MREGKADSRVGSGRPVPKKPLTNVLQHEQLIL